jgi:DNA mismatch repair protein MutS2
MARSGLPVPCEPHSELGWFEQVLTDIGDEQSISRSLSTFSAHVARLSEYLQLAGRGSLVLLDEVAGGTDPDEGAALAAAILQRLVARGAAVATTTHYERLKRLGAGEAESFVNASVGFDWTRMAPTFSLSWGTPGRSSALAVAERYGIPATVVEQARTLLPKEQLHQQALLEKLETEHQLLSESREKLEAELQEQRELTRHMQAEADQAREKERRRLAQQASELTQEVLEARALVRRAKAELKETKPDPKAVREVEKLLSQAAAPVTLQGNLTQAIAEQRQGIAHSPTVGVAELSPGVKVHLPHLNAVGEVVSDVQKGVVRVNVSGMKLSVPVTKLRLLQGAARAAETAPKPRHLGLRRGHKPARDVAPAAGFVPVRTSWNTCDLRGLRVEAGLETVNGFVDRMLQSNEPAAYFLHGHGTGAMKEAVRDYLSASPHVARWEPASREDGGDALTLCWF